LELVPRDKLMTKAFIKKNAIRGKALVWGPNESKMHSYSSSAFFSVFEGGISAARPAQVPAAGTKTAGGGQDITLGISPFGGSGHFSLGLGRRV
jgi:hypothetical protein